ncbi:Outer membrane efflux protein [compost metagenome]
MLIKNMLVLALLLLGHQVAGACESIKSYKDILRCAEENAPAQQIAQARLEGAQAGMEAQAQWKNPEFTGQTISGKVAGENSRETDLALNFPIDLTRSAKRNAAEAGVALSQAEYSEAKAALRAEVYLKLHRLRQLLHEKSMIDESLVTFTKLTSSYERRPLLSPEQQVSLALFRMAKSDYQLKQSSNIEDVQQLEKSLSLLTQISASEIRKNLPPAMNAWPSSFGAAACK